MAACDRPNTPANSAMTWPIIDPRAPPPVNFRPRPHSPATPHVLAPESSPAVDAEGPEQFPHLAADGIIRRVLVPGVAAPGKDHQFGVLFFLRLGAAGKRVPDCLGGFRPQQAAPGNPCFGT